MRNIFTAISIILLVALFAVKVAIAQGSWTQKADFPGIKYHSVIFTIGTKAYVGGGYSKFDFSLKDFWEWDSATNVWTRKADFPVNRTAAVGFSIGTKGYIGTGNDMINESYFNDFWEYDPASDTWTQKASIPVADGRNSAVGFSIGTKGYIGTGRNNQTVYEDFWEWDQATDTWTQKADFRGGPREEAVGFSIGNKGYMACGHNGLTLHKDFWEWDQATDTWTRKTDFGGAGRISAVGFSMGNKGYIGIGRPDFIGQEEFDPTKYYKDFWEWDQATDTWTQKADFGGKGRFGAVGFSMGNRGYMGLGFADYLFEFSDFWEFNPTVKDSLIDILPEGSVVTKLSSDQFVFTEGPVWYSDSILLFIEDGIGSPNIFQYNPEGKQISAWPTSTSHSVGLTLDRDGNLMGTSSNIIMINKDGTLNKTLASSYNDKPFNNPNDLIADKKGGVYFSDPDFFLTTLPQGTTAVYYIDSAGVVKRVIDDLDKPNGLVLSPDGAKLYVVDTEISNLYSWDVAPDGSVSGKSIFAKLDTMQGVNNYADGMAVDSVGNIYVATNTGIQVFTPLGAPITTIVVPESPSNCDFGGKDFKTLYITARKNIYSIDLKYPGYVVSREKGMPNALNPLSDQPLVTVFPNPVQNELYIDLTGITGVLEVLDITGRSVLLKEIKENNSSIDVSGLKHGIYLVKVLYDNQLVIGKFVKQ